LKPILVIGESEMYWSLLPFANPVVPDCHGKLQLEQGVMRPAKQRPARSEVSISATPNIFPANLMYQDE
jgi:hypothetical protein